MISRETREEFAKRMVDALDMETLKDLAIQQLIGELSVMKQSDLENHIREIYPDLLEE